MKLKTLLYLPLILLCQTAFSQKLATGIWRGALKTQNGIDIPFNFEVTTHTRKPQIAIINGTERFKVDGISFKKDSVFIQMPLFDSEFRLKKVAGNLQGKWIRHLGDHDVAMNFTATPNTPWRMIKDPGKPAVNITGRWSATFVSSNGNKDITVGEFKQTANKLTGTILTTTGDYRYLEGVVTAGNMLLLSAFDGNHNYLFTGKINGKNIIDGKLYSGLTSVTNWTAHRDNNAKLPDAYSLTALKPGYKKISFSFLDMNHKKVSLTDVHFKNKVVIVQILGSWCPNCMDETAYLINYYKKYHRKGVEIVGLAYERTKDYNKSKTSLLQLRQRFNIPYPLLITGYTASGDDPAKSLPMLAKVLGFPTTIIIDKKGNVRKIHTGFSGPGTGKYYTEFKKEFETLTDGLLAEQ
ncbi:MAG: TlpA disulfide reductase family protein [Mucilaginibacter sp.]